MEIEELKNWLDEVRSSNGKVSDREIDREIITELKKALSENDSDKVFLIFNNINPEMDDFNLKAELNLFTEINTINFILKSIDENAPDIKGWEEVEFFFHNKIRNTCSDISEGYLKKIFVNIIINQPSYLHSNNLPMESYLPVKNYGDITLNNSEIYFSSNPQFLKFIDRFTHFTQNKYSGTKSSLFCLVAQSFNYSSYLREQASKNNDGREYYDEKIKNIQSFLEKDNLINILIKNLFLHALKRKEPIETILNMNEIFPNYIDATSLVDNDYSPVDVSSYFEKMKGKAKGRSWILSAYEKGWSSEQILSTLPEKEYFPKHNITFFIQEKHSPQRTIEMLKADLGRCFREKRRDHIVLIGSRPNSVSDPNEERYLDKNIIKEILQNKWSIDNIIEFHHTIKSKGFIFGRVLLEDFIVQGHSFEDIQKINQTINVGQDYELHRIKIGKNAINYAIDRKWPIENIIELAKMNNTWGETHDGILEAAGYSFEDLKKAERSEVCIPHWKNQNNVLEIKEGMSFYHTKFLIKNGANYKEAVDKYRKNGNNGNNVFKNNFILEMLEIADPNDVIDYYTAIPSEVAIAALQKKGIDSFEVFKKVDASIDLQYLKRALEDGHSANKVLSVYNTIDRETLDLLIEQGADYEEAIDKYRKNDNNVLKNNFILEMLEIADPNDVIDYYTAIPSEVAIAALQKKVPLEKVFRLLEHEISTQDLFLMKNEINPEDFSSKFFEDLKKLKYSKESDKYFNYMNIVSQFFSSEEIEVRIEKEKNLRNRIGDFLNRNRKKENKKEMTK